MKKRYSEEQIITAIKEHEAGPVYKNAEGGGAMIMDKYPRKSDSVSNEETGQRCSAADEVAQTA